MVFYIHFDQVSKNSFFTFTQYFSLVTVREMLVLKSCDRLEAFISHSEYIVSWFQSTVDAQFDSWLIFQWFTCWSWSDSSTISWNTLGTVPTISSWSHSGCWCKTCSALRAFCPPSSCGRWRRWRRGTRYFCCLMKKKAILNWGCSVGIRDLFGCTVS